MDFKQLRTFSCAANTLNFSEASAQLGYVQSAVTNQIKALEQELKVKLFERNGRGVELTSAGLQLLSYTQKMLALREEAKTTLTEHIEAKPIRIGGHETVISYYLPQLISRYRQQFPHFRCSIEPTSMANLKNALLLNQIDVAFILEKPFVRQGIKVHTYQDEPIVVICAPEHPLANKSSVNVTELSHEHLLLTEPGCCYRNQFERLLITAGAYNTAKVSEFISIETIKQCVKLNLGIAAISKAAVAQELAHKTLATINLANAGLSSNIHFAYNNQTEHSAAIKNFIAFAECFQF